MIHSRESAEISSSKTKPDRVPSGQFLLLVRGYFTVELTVIAECGTGKTLISLGAVHAQRPKALHSTGHGPAPVG